MKNEKILSILLPVFNVETYLEECLSSVISQWDSRIEIVVYDDCSTDQSSTILQRIKKTYPTYIEIITGDINRGLSVARNRLIDNSSGQYIWFIDSDDKLSAGAISRALTVIKINSPSLIICDFFTLDESPAKSKMRIRRSHHGIGGYYLDTRKALANTIFKDKLYAWCRIFDRRLCAQDLRFPEGKVFEDINFTISITARSERISYVKEPWVVYRKRAGSILRTLDDKKMMDWRDALKNIEPNLQRLGINPCPIEKLAISYCIFSNYIDIFKKLKKQGCEQECVNVLVEMRDSLPLGEREIIFRLLFSTHFLKAINFIWKKRVLRVREDFS